MGGMGKGDWGEWGGCTSLPSMGQLNTRSGVKGVVLGLLHVAEERRCSGYILRFDKSANR